METIIEALCEVESVLPRVDRLKAVFGEHEDCCRILALIYSDLGEFFERVYRLFRRKAWHFWFAFDWRLFQRRFSKLLHGLQHHCELLDKQSAAVHYSEMKEMRDRRLQETEDFERRRRSKHVHAVVSWLSSAEADQEDFLHNMANKRQADVCDWILSDDNISSWIGEGPERETVWLTGKPGAGKSFLCSMIVDHLTAHDEYTTLYYFCGRLPTNGRGGADCAIVMRTLAVQLVRQNLDIASLIHEAHLEKASSRSSSAIKQLLVDVQANVKPIRVVLDGIDECEPHVQKDIIRNLLDIQRVGSKCLKVLISSREEPTVRTSMKKTFTLALNDKTTDALKRYIQSKVTELQNTNPLSNHDLRQAEKFLQAKADGMFLWVHLVIEHLKQQESSHAINKALGELPKGLDEAYGLILMRFRDLATQDRVLLILYWLCEGRRPLTTEEIADGVVLCRSRMLDKESRIQNTHVHIVDQCKPLVEETTSGVLQLVHFSAREYLLHEFSGKFVDCHKANLNIALACTRTLNCALRLVPRYSGDLTERDQEVFVLGGSLGLHNYAHAFWLTHVQAYLQGVKSHSERDEQLLGELLNLTRTHKHRSMMYDHSDRSLNQPESLAILSDLNDCYVFCRGWLRFQKLLEEAMTEMKSVQDQQKWKKDKDETFFSLIEIRLQEITETLLVMDQNAAPHHIDREALQDFKKRYGWACRYLHCTQTFQSEEARNAHEASHVPTFPCDQCDFSGRGFRTRKDLERHIRRYHSPLEGHEVPESLDCAAESLDPTQMGPNPLQWRLVTGRECWNEQGRAALKKGFRKILQRLEAQSLAERLKNGLREVDRSPNHHMANRRTEKAQTVARGLARIRGKIESEDVYGSLLEFQQDLENISGLWSNDFLDDRFRTLHPEDFESALTGTFNSSTLNARLDSLSLVSQPLFPENHTSQGNQLPSRPSSERFGLYWSFSERTDLHKLVGQHGRDFEAIAQRLKTKTPHEIQDRFDRLVQQGATDLAQLANQVESERQKQEQSKKNFLSAVGSPWFSGGTDTTELSPSPGQCWLDGHSPLPPVSPPSATPPSSNQSAATHSTATPSTTNSLAEVSQETPEAKTAKLTTGISAETKIPGKRRRERSVICKLCQPERQFRNEYTWKKHFSRVHEETRRVWICNGAFTDGNFLSGCKSCDEGKSYQTNALAAVHLKEKHFVNASASTLSRWIRWREEPNPSFQPPSSAIKPSSNRRGGAKQSAEDNARTRQLEVPALKTSSTFTSTLIGLDGNPIVPGYEEFTRRLKPEDIDMTDGSNLLRAGGESSKEEALLPNVPFGISSGNPPPPTIGYLRPHERDKALIRLSQIEDFLHLSRFQRDACKDQVEEIFNVLNNNSEYSDMYQKGLADLERLSRVLLGGLREWRSKQMLTPKLSASFAFDRSSSTLASDWKAQN